MAMNWDIPGFCKIQINSVDAGMTDAEDTIRVEEQVKELVLHSNQSGPEMPDKAINLGRVVRLTIPLAKWDPAVVDPVNQTPGASTVGQVGSLGNDVVTFAVKIVPQLAGTYAYNFGLCRMVDNQAIEGFGIKAKKQTLIIEAYPDPSALATATTAVYTKISQ